MSEKPRKPNSRQEFVYADEKQRPEINWKLRHSRHSRYSRPLRIFKVEKLLLVVLQFLDRFVNIRQRLMLAVLDEAGHDAGLPALGQFLQRGNIQIAVVEIGLEFRHVPGEKAAILAD